ncbi:MAG: hypothetical protein IJ524_01960 [Bacteroidales bacterium]|nr:hypothetical protein [Bacteroidales bacterium]
MEVSISDEGIRLEYDVDGSLFVYNETDSMLYIDLGESFFISHNELGTNYGNAIKIYNNAVVTTTNIQSRSMNVNAGAVTRAVGAGPITQTVANGVNMGETSTSGTFVQTTEERFVGIPPHSRSNVKFFRMTRPSRYSLERKKGVYSKEDLMCEHILTFSNNIDNPQWKKIRNKFYITRCEVKKIGFFTMMVSASPCYFNTGEPNTLECFSSGRTVEMIE